MENADFNSLKCIWMSSNIVDYKLCDRNFNCDNCLFDKVMRNKISGDGEVENKSQDLLQNVISTLEKQEYNSSYTYLKNNLMVKNIFNNAHYLGFNPIALSVLDNVFTIEHCAESDDVIEDKPIIKLKGNWGEISVNSPISFTCLGKIQDQKEVPLQEKWFGLIQVEKKELMEKAISTEDYKKNTVLLVKELTRFQLNYPEIGVTMMDGGEKVKYLYQAIGSQNYNSLLKTLFRECD